MKSTNHTPTDQKESLNPEIREKAEELFSLLEDEIKKSHEDKLAEAMSEQLGDFIKNSKGFDQLLYVYELSQTRYEKAIYGIEESVHYMNDSAFFTLTKLYKNVLIIAELWNTPKEERNEWSANMFGMRISKAKAAAEKIRDKVAGHWKYRAKSYGKEITELKKGQ